MPRFEPTNGYRQGQSNNFLFNSASTASNCGTLNHHVTGPRVVIEKKISKMSFQKGEKDFGEGPVGFHMLRISLPRIPPVISHIPVVAHNPPKTFLTWENSC